MGLDMWLYRKRVLEKENEDPMIKYIKEEELIYWRKANQIFNYFNELYGEDIEDCENKQIYYDDLIELKDICLKVINDHNLADELLPTSRGFFFGSIEYDEYYYNDLKKTIECIENIEKTHQDEDQYIFYAWW